MIITKLQGGLGNQLFQYAIGRHLAHLRDTPLAFDISELGKSEPGIIKRDFKLSAFAIDARAAQAGEVRAFTSAWRRLLSGRTYVQEKGYQFHPSVLIAPTNTYLIGFWQSWKYIEPIADIVRKELVLKEPPEAYYSSLMAQARGTESVAVHVRRQDYVTDPRTNVFHGVLSPSYYQDAAKALAAKGVKNPTYFIFSDDIAWCKENVRFDAPLVFCEPPHTVDTQELVAMSACKHFIIANSSFSWWGAWLNPSPGKIVVAPKKWVNDPKDPNERLLPEWIAI